MNKPVLNIKQKEILREMQKNNLVLKHSLFLKEYQNVIKLVEMQIVKAGYPCTIDEEKLKLALGIKDRPARKKETV